MYLKLAIVIQMAFKFPFYNLLFYPHLSSSLHFPTNLSSFSLSLMTISSPSLFIFYTSSIFSMNKSVYFSDKENKLQTGKKNMGFFLFDSVFTWIIEI